MDTTQRPKQFAKDDAERLARAVARAEHEMSRIEHVLPAHVDTAWTVNCDSYPPRVRAFVADAFKTTYESELYALGQKWYP